jgi:hypothetical protein
VSQTCVPLINQPNKILNNIYSFMKKTMLKGIALLALGIAFGACSHDLSVDENAKAKAELAKKGAKYQEAFVKRFESIDQNHTWGFGQTSVTRTRAGVSEVSAFTGWELPNDLTPIKENSGTAKRVRQAFIDGKGVDAVDFPLTNYFMQHVCQPDDKNSIGQVYAYDSSSDKKDWIPVLNFTEGKNNVENGFTNTKLKGTTLMSGMGGAGDANGKLFCYEDDEVKGGLNYDYSFYKDPETGWWFLGLKHVYTQGKKTVTTYWVIKLAEAKSTVDKVKYEGRVFCEDMGEINGDFDFNDLVFDAQIFESGKIEILVQAAGGTLPIKVAGQDVHTLFGGLTMVNTGLDGHWADPVMITIDAATAKANGWTEIIKIPIIVSPNTTDALDYELTAVVGNAPTKVCTYRGVDWPEEYVSIEKAYTDFTQWVKQNNVPERWSDNKVEKYTDLILNN